MASDPNQIVDALNQLPEHQQNRVFVDAFSQLAQPQQQRVFLDAFSQLGTPQQAQTLKALQTQVLPPPPKNVAGALWLIVVSSFAFVFVGGALLLYLLVNDGKSTEVIGPLVTGALGVLAGLLAPSPASGTQA